ncbi:MAG: chromosome segregation protein SMC, partial [Clostridiales bacterium]|nr:chromosome segregation protein SMC [Clostridiales bacterium]
MYLKSIEIQGFKSFANRIVLEFHNGITGIVGPNGSGKSNIADAVRWVLGEQKVRQLRSTGMQDVIFAGTETRRPVSFAYVAITLDNSDRALGLGYNEVTVARRVYRSGESEYLLNGTACRLRDIHELFYDTGIGKEGYSIIGQGQIDRILSGKPEERRELFDEAAGIVKFKRRKQLTMKKLENEQQNMLRVTDIMSELERQVGPLARQSEKARIYLKKKEELKSCEVNSFLMEMDRMDKESASVADKYDIATKQQNETSGEFDAIRVKYEDLERRMETNDARIADLNSQIAAIDVDREKNEGRINVLMEQINTIRQGESHVNDRLDELVADIEKKEQTGREYSDEKAETDRQIAQVEQTKNELAHRLEVLQKSEKEAEEQIEAGKQEIMALLEARAALEGDQQRATTMIEQANIRQAQLNQQMVTDRSTESPVADQLKEKEEALEELDGRILDREKKKISLLAKRRKWQEQSAEISKELDTIRQQYNRQSSELAALKNIAERYDGYGNGIKKVMERRTDTRGIRGVVADLIHVDKRYETAIETALGGSIQNIVVDDEDTAKAMIAYLKENRFGRVTFLPLTSVSASDNIPAKKALSETGAVGMADTLVETESRYRGIAGYLLGRILVVDNIDHAVAIEKKYHYSIRIVTLEGESLLPGGSISGGAFKSKGNLLGRTREIEALEKSLEAMKVREKKAEERLTDVQTAGELVGDDLNDLAAEMTELGLKQNTLKVEVEHLSEEKAKHDARFKDILDEIASLEDQKSESELDKEQIILQLAHSKQREADIISNNEKLDKKLTGISAEAARLGDEISEITVTMAQLA